MRGVGEVRNATLHELKRLDCGLFLFVVFLTFVFTIWSVQYVPWATDDESGWVQTEKDDLMRFKLIYHVEALDELHKINIYWYNLGMFWFRWQDQTQKYLLEFKKFGYLRDSSGGSISLKNQHPYLNITQRQDWQHKTDLKWTNMIFSAVSKTFLKKRRTSCIMMCFFFLRVTNLAANINRHLRLNLKQECYQIKSCSIFTPMAAIKDKLLTTAWVTLHSLQTLYRISYSAMIRSPPAMGEEETRNCNETICIAVKSTKPNAVKVKSPFGVLVEVQPSCL